MSLSTGWALRISAQDLSLSLSCAAPGPSSLGVVWLREAPSEGGAGLSPESSEGLKCHCAENHNRLAFGHSNFTPWLQFRLVTLKDQNQKCCSTWVVIQAWKISPQRLLKPSLGSTSSCEQTVLVKLKRSSALLVNNFWGQVWPKQEDAPPHHTSLTHHLLFIYITSCLTCIHLISRCRAGKMTAFCPIYLVTFPCFVQIQGLFMEKIMKLFFFLFK